MIPLLISFSWLLHPFSTPKSSQAAYTYWYSAQQREALDQVLDGPKDVQPHYYVVIGGKTLEYTECEPAPLKEPYGRFTDYQKLGTVSGQACQSW